MQISDDLITKPLHFFCVRPEGKVVEKWPLAMPWGATFRTSSLCWHFPFSSVCWRGATTPVIARKSCPQCFGSLAHSHHSHHGALKAKSKGSPSRANMWICWHVFAPVFTNMSETVIEENEEKNPQDLQFLTLEDLEVFRMGATLAVVVLLISVASFGMRAWTGSIFLALYCAYLVHVSYSELLTWYT